MRLGIHHHIDAKLIDETTQEHHTGQEEIRSEDQTLTALPLGNELKKSSIQENHKDNQEVGGKTDEWYLGSQRKELLQHEEMAQWHQTWSNVSRA